MIIYYDYDEQKAVEWCKHLPLYQGCQLNAKRQTRWVSNLLVFGSHWHYSLLSNLEVWLKSCTVSTEVMHCTNYTLFGLGKNLCSRMSKRCAYTVKFKVEVNKFAETFCFQIEW